MTPDDKPDAGDSATPPSTQVEPPRIYLAACGTLCDVFWWARRNPPPEEPAPLPVKNETP